MSMNLYNTIEIRTLQNEKNKIKVYNLLESVISKSCEINTRLEGHVARKELNEKIIICLFNVLALLLSGGYY